MRRHYQPFYNMPRTTVHWYRDSVAFIPTKLSRKPSTTLTINVAQSLELFSALEQVFTPNNEGKQLLKSRLICQPPISVHNLSWPDFTALQILPDDNSVHPSSFSFTSDDTQAFRNDLQYWLQQHDELQHLPTTTWSQITEPVDILRSHPLESLSRQLLTPRSR